MISAQYGAPDKKIDPIQPSNRVKITSNEVRLTKSCPDGWSAVIKKEPALVRHVIVPIHTHFIDLWLSINIDL